MNRYILKLAEVNYNINGNLDIDPYHSAMSDRMDYSDRGNSILISRGYKPSLTDASHDVAMAQLLTRLDRNTNLRPNETMPKAAGAIGGITSGALTAASVQSLTRNPLLSTLLGLGVGIATGIGTKKLLYTKSKSKEDDATMEANKNLLLEHLNKHYVKL